MNARDRFLNRPLAIWPGHAPLMLEVLRAPAIDGMARMLEQLGDRRPYDVIDGVAVVPVQGVLVHDLTWWSWDETEYGWVAQTLATAVADPDVGAIALHVNSPGGEVAGCFDLADAIYALRGAKPIWAIVDEAAYSAAYALASAADKVMVPRTGGTGSVGVVALHIDFTKALEDWGIKVTTFQFGARKTDSYPTTALSDEAKARFQADVDAMGEMFVALVARNRGTDAARVRKTEAATFLGEAGVAEGLADAVMSADEAFLALVASIS